MRRRKIKKQVYAFEVFFRKLFCLRLRPRHYVLFLSASILLLVIVTTLSANAHDTYVTIIRSPKVKTQLKKAAPKDQKQLEQAIKVGNRFIQLRFNGDDRYFADNPNGEKEWDENLAPLLSMSGEEWEQYRENRWEVVNGDRIKGAYYLVACPNVGLVDIKKTENGWTLLYRAKLLGAFPDVTARKILKLDKARAGKSYELEIAIGNKNRIVSEYSSEKFIAESNYQYSSQLKFEEQECKSSLESYKDSSISRINKQKSEALTKERYNTIQLIKKQLDIPTSICTSP